MDHDDEQTLQEAWCQFDSGEFESACRLFLGVHDQLKLESKEFKVLIELLADRENFLSAADLIKERVGRNSDNTDGIWHDRIAWMAELMHLLQLGGNQEGAFAAGLDLIEAVAFLEDVDWWNRATHKGWIEFVESAARSPRDQLSVLEIEALAPEITGLPARVIQRVEEIGHSNADDAPLARDVEVLLHALGATEAAYRVERSKRIFRERDRGSGGVRPGMAKPLTGLSIVIAGGHPALRSLIRRILLKQGAKSVAGIPSAKEASRVGRDVQAALIGSDVAVILARQIAHSTSDQIRIAAAKLGVPVVAAESSGTTGVRRALERWISS